MVQVGSILIEIVSALVVLGLIMVQLVHFEDLVYQIFGGRLTLEAGWEGLIKIKARMYENCGSFNTS